ncbi:sulfatase-like hydrolase/transferase [Mangrovimonas spongiae]|nr:sulfatase-like hydrolase/transferase [Mangrovimonas spongiae]
MCLHNGILQKSYTLFTTLKVENKSFNEYLQALKMTNYVFPENLEVSGSGKNIIVISLESFEKGYLSEKYSKLTPFLRSLIRNPSWQYYEMNQNEGSKWTSGSLYTYLTGFPAYFGTMHNNIFQSSYHSNITGLGHILKKEGYKTTFIGTDAKVSGTQDMLYALKIDNIIDKSTLGAFSQDKDLFNVAKEAALNSSKTNTPFSLFISTLSTHFPNGIYDKRMEAYITPKASDLEFMVAATDYMLKDFIDYLKEVGIYKNTIIYIFPDHLKMGDDTIFKGTGERGLFILTNAKEEVVETKNLKNLYQIDLPEIILKGAEINTNATFLTNHVNGDKNQFIQDHISDITALNVSGFERTELSPYIIPEISKHVKTYKKDTLRFIAHAGGKIDDKIYTNSLEALNTNYAKGFRLFELDILTSSDNKFVAAHYWDDWIKMTEYTGKTPVSRKEFMSHKLYGKYTPLDMKSINNWFKSHPDAVLVTDKINTPKAFASQFIDPDRLIMELFTWNAVREGSQAKIKSVMPSQNVIFDLKKNYLDSLKKYHIKHVAISRNIIASNQELLNTLKANNIKVYAYNINEYIDRDEMYVVKHEMDFIYGIYADDWFFK